MFQVLNAQVLLTRMSAKKIKKRNYQTGCTGCARGIFNFFFFLLSSSFMAICGSLRFLIWPNELEETKLMANKYKITVFQQYFQC